MRSLHGSARTSTRATLDQIDTVWFDTPQREFKAHQEEEPVRHGCRRRSGSGPGLLGAGCNRTWGVIAARVHRAEQHGSRRLTLRPGSRRWPPVQQGACAMRGKQPRARRSQRAATGCGTSGCGRTRAANRGLRRCAPSSTPSSVSASTSRPASSSRSTSPPCTSCGAGGAQGDTRRPLQACTTTLPSRSHWPIVACEAPRCRIRRESMTGYMDEFIRERRVARIKVPQALPWRTRHMITPEDRAVKHLRPAREYWNDRGPEMRRLRNAYLMRYWQRNMSYDEPAHRDQSRAYELIESFVASLFVRDPSVVVKPDLRGRRRPELTEEVANDWLMMHAREIEDALRQSLIYPWAGHEAVRPSDTKDVLRRVSITPVGPWDVIVDESAASSAGRRSGSLATATMCPIEEAKKKYGNKKYAKRSFCAVHRLPGRGRADRSAATGETRTRLPSNRSTTTSLLSSSTTSSTSKLLVWSPDFAEGDKFLYDGIELDRSDVEGSRMLEKFDGIPFRTASPIGRSCPSCRCIMSREPDEPLRGYSALRRVYDQVVEVNTIRTFQANGIRRAARQWMVEKGLLDEEAMSKIAQGQDGEFIEVELSPGPGPAGLGPLHPVPHSPVPAGAAGLRAAGRGRLCARQHHGSVHTGRSDQGHCYGNHGSRGILGVARSAAWRASGTQPSQRSRRLRRHACDSHGRRDRDGASGGKAQALSSDDLTGDFGFFAQDSGLDSDVRGSAPSRSS